MITGLVVCVSTLYLHLVLDYEWDDLRVYRDLHAQPDPQDNEEESYLPQVLLSVARGPSRLVNLFGALHKTQVGHGGEVRDASQGD